MKFTKLGRAALAVVASLGFALGLTSCQQNYTVGYVFVTGSQYNQIASFEEQNSTGNLFQSIGSPYGSGGTNPIRVVVLPGGRYLYVLNQGTPGTADPATGNIPYSGAHISLFAIGGNGTLAFQANYESQGSDSQRIATDASGKYIFVLDEYSPVGTNVSPTGGKGTSFPCQSSDGKFHPYGDVSVYSIDGNTGRLTLVTNQQQQSSNGTQLTYFPVGCFPIDFHPTSGYLYTADAGTNATADVNTVFAYAINTTNGQLTLTQNAPLQTGAMSISAINGDTANKYLYILDPTANMIRPFTVGANGALQSQTNGPMSNSTSLAGNPTQLVVDTQGKFLYVANAGPPSSNLTNPNSDITAYFIDSSGTLSTISGEPYSTGSGPQCIIEDTSKQYFYTANFNANTVTGKVYNPSTGFMVPMQHQTDFSTIGNPTFCATTAAIF
ncbi:lactonase family protein [Acidipila rosea]|uniref:6-phosphogluconolactonase (Cycloisomerase 2 family) n=1 Tax=Acidipila rosea TaxID=768535 RepID=A0A4R1KZ38_9BACT|nr:beta-propeller fold lactonase family protein [Acidipila rosea]MBW4028907.1 lactonase family protein [Acidobacteriota bacterium]MBW4045473.1 lactonase family protein [Acidobacteriota bacterium]TCK70806.1 6-phosphogluconolactonase (cycloisomerase 2 family) [Acidipila rosea]